MSKKFTMLLMSLLAFVGVAKAQYYVIESVGENITDLSTLTEDSYVALYNVGKSKFIYESGNHMLCMGTAAEVGAGHEYIWQVHKDGDTFLFTSASGRYFSTPLDGKDVYTVKSDNAAKDKFTITAHSEDKTKWLVKSSNANIYWDAQDARFVGWAGNGTNSRYEIRPVTVSAAVENDFNKLITTNENDIKWYTIKNVNSGKYATYAGDAATMTQQAAISGPSLFYFTGRATADGATVGIHNLFAGDNLCVEYNSWTATGREWAIKQQAKGLSIAHTNNANNAWNNKNGWGAEVAYWGAGDGGSAWQIEIVTDFTEYLTAAKAAAIAEIEELSRISAIYPDATQFKTDINAVSSNSAEGLLAVNNILVNYRKSIDGKAVKFVNCATDGRGGRFLGYDKKNSRIAAILPGSDESYWTIKWVGGNVNNHFKLYNFVNNVWLGGPDYKWDESTTTNEETGETTTTKNNYRTPAIENEADAVVYKFVITGDNQTTLVTTDKNQMVHVKNGEGYRIMSHYSTSDAASLWNVTGAATIQVTRDEYTDFVADKSTLMNQLIGYAKQLQDNYGLVKDGDKIAVVVNHPSGDDSQPSSNLLDGNNGTFVHSAYSGEDNTTHHYIEVELSEATQNIFCYFSKRNNNNRPSVVKVYAGNSADALTEVATLNLAESTDDNVQAFFSGAIDLGAAYTHLRFVVTKTNTDTKYFTLSEFYVLPVNTITEGIAALAGASIVDTDLEARLTAADKSLKNLQLPETLAEVRAALDANVSNHADEPQLGQYTTAAYNELKAAYDACTTIDQLDAVFAAFDKFKKAKNLPVFTINGAGKDYAKGKSVYDDNDGAPAFKTTDIYDKTMWWALDQVETTVSATGSNYIGIYNVGTGNGFWGESSIKIAATSDAKEGVFLFYTPANGSTVHFQQSGSTMVYYNSTGSDTGSATSFTYLGNSYDLNKLTDEKIAAFRELEATFNAKAYLVGAQVGTGAGQYQGDHTAFNDKITAVDQFLTHSTLTAKATLTVNAINQYKADIETLAAALVLNTPVDGTYYRIKGANSAANPGGYYITGHTNADGGRIALTSEADASTIYYYNEGKLQAYVSREFIALNNNYYLFADETHPASVITFAASSRVAGAYTIKSADRYLHYKVYNGNVEIDRCGEDIHADHDWYLEEINAEDLPAAFDIVYNFKFEGDVKYTQTTPLALGDNYPDVSIELPYGVSLKDATTPEGTVDGAKTFEFELSVDKALPFEAVAEGNTPSKWYYAQMHAYPGYAFYVSANENNMVWHGTNEDAAKYIDEAADLDDYLWGFVGDLWNGFKLVNKAGKAVSSTGSGDVTVVDEINNATKFIASNSSAAGEWFCLKYPTNGNYLNLDAYKTIIQHYGQNDNGSSFFVTEYNKEYSLNMATDEATGESYATFYSQYRVAIPEGVTAWVVSSVENNEVLLDEVTGGVLPANTAVILTGETTDPIETSAAATATVGTNLLRGTATKTLIEAAANTSYYVLAKGENGVVKLYKAFVNKNAEGIDGSTHFYNNANKVYLPVEIAEPQVAQALAFRFRGKGQGTTEIEVPATNDHQPAVIYDLTGRRITEIVEKGIYIVNGKKVVIK